MPNSKNIFVGIDLSATAANTSLVAVEAGASGILTVSKRVGNWGNVSKDEDFLDCILEDIGKLIATNPEAPIFVAIDVPFGWPSHFAKAVSKHQVGKPLSESKIHSRDPYRYRETDLFVRDGLPELLNYSEKKVNPLSVSTDKLGVTAIVGSELVFRLNSELKFKIPSDSDKFPKVGPGARTLIEVYPTASFFAWTGKTKRDTYQKSSSQLFKLVQKHFQSKPHQQPINTLKFKNEHQFDAWLCAMTAYEFSLKRCFLPSKVKTMSQSIMKKEGWIWIPEV